MNRTFDLFVHLGATDDNSIFLSSHVGDQRHATLDVNKPGTDIALLLDTVLAQIPLRHQRQRTAPNLVLALLYDSYKGKMGVGKIQSGSIARRQSVLILGKDGAQNPGKSRPVHSGLERVDLEQAEAAKSAVAGLTRSALETRLQMPNSRRPSLASPSTS